MSFTFWPTDLDFEKNIMCVRRLTLMRENPIKHILIVRNDVAHDVISCQIRPDGWFAYSVADYGEFRCELCEINKVEIAL